MRTCEVCREDPAARWMDAFPDMDGYLAIELRDATAVCLGCAASNFDELCCQTCRETVAALIDYEFVEGAL